MTSKGAPRGNPVVHTSSRLTGTRVEPVPRVVPAWRADFPQHGDVLDGVASRLTRSRRMLREVGPSGRRGGSRFTLCLQGSSVQRGRVLLDIPGLSGSVSS
jgi:hypothetical protein